jgi:DnaJ-class molecular chaperone
MKKRCWQCNGSKFWWESQSNIGSDPLPGVYKTCPICHGEGVIKERENLDKTKEKNGRKRNKI